MACEPFDCSKCGQRHEICSGHVTKDENGNKIEPRPCTKYPREGAAVCQAHGGNAPQVIAAAKGRILDSEARRLLNLEGFEPIHDPYTALAELAGETVKLKDILLAKVEELTNLKTTLFTEKGATEQIDVVFSAYERALDRCEKILSGMARLDLEDRIARLHTRINTDAVNKILVAMDEALDAARITGNAREVIAFEFGSRLRGDQRADSKPFVAAESAPAALAENSEAGTTPA